MDAKTLLAIAITALTVIYIIYEIIKEKHKLKREKEFSKEQSLFFKKAGCQLEQNALVNQEILKYFKISSQRYSEEITESQTRIVIESVLSNSQNEMFRYISKVIEENHIKGNEKEVTSKVKLFINNKLHKDFLLLKEFKYKEKSLGEFPVNDWKEYLIECMLENVLKEKGEKSLHGTLQNVYDSFKYDILEKLLS